MSQRGLLLIISGPAGVGKTTIAHHIEQQLDGTFSISMTTRPQTKLETNGEDYHFVDDDQFNQTCDAGGLLESAQVFGRLYGTPKQPVLDALAHGRLMILEIDVQGAVQVKKNMPQAFAVFIKPPSEQVLLERLRGRKRDTEEAIQSRFAQAKAEIAHAESSGIYDQFIVNDDLQTAKETAIKIVSAEMQR